MSDTPFTKSAYNPGVNVSVNDQTQRKLTIFPRFTLLHGSLANSLAAEDIISPVFKTSSTANSISGCISGFSWAMLRPRSTKFAVARSTAATNT